MRSILIPVFCFFAATASWAQQRMEALDSIMQQYDNEYQANMVICEQNVPVGVVYNPSLYPGTNEVQFYYDAITAVRKALNYNQKNLQLTDELYQQMKTWRRETADATEKAVLKAHIEELKTRQKYCKQNASNNRKLERLLMKRYDQIRR